MVLQPLMNNGSDTTERLRGWVPFYEASMAPSPELCWSREELIDHSGSCVFTAYYDQAYAKIVPSTRRSSSSP